MSSDRIRVGVVGTTSYTETHIARLLASPRADLVALAGRNAERTQRVAASHGIPLSFIGYDAMISSGDIDAIVVLAPDELHEAIAVSALQAGIHVMCEKPLARTADEALRMVDAARTSGLVNMSFFHLRTSPHHRELRRLLEQGVIGRVQSARFTLAHGFFRSDEYNWRFDAGRAGGVIADLGCYLFDLARWYVGDVAAVAAHGASIVRRPAPDGREYLPAPDSGVGVLAFESGAHATFDVSVISTMGPGMQRNTVHLQGEDGRLELTHTFAGAELLLFRPDSDEAEQVEPSADHQGQEEEFIDAIVEGRDAEPSFIDGWRVQQIVDAAVSASHNRQWVSIGQAGAE